LLRADDKHPSYSKADALLKGRHQKKATGVMLPDRFFDRMV